MQPEQQSRPVTAMQKKTDDELFLARKIDGLPTRNRVLSSTH